MAAVKRNELMAAKYGIEVREKALKTGTLAGELKTARTAGTQYADAVLAPRVILRPQRRQASF